MSTTASQENSAVSRLAALALAALPLHASPQSAAVPGLQSTPIGGFANDVVIPQTRIFSSDGESSVSISDVAARVEIVEQVALVDLEIGLANAGDRQREAELVFPVPSGVAVRGFDFQGSAAEPSARLLPAAEARDVYDRILDKSRDPALLELAGRGLVRTSVFPVPAHGTQRVRLLYEEVLPATDGRIDFTLWRSELLAQSFVPWKFDVRIRSGRPISTVYSPSHEVDVRRVPSATGGEFAIALLPGAERQPGSFRLSWLFERDGLSATLFACPDPLRGGGHFLLLSGLPSVAADPTTPPRAREVTLVLDRSGSMNGEKFEQARGAAKKVLSRLQDTDRFRLVVYSDAAQRFRVESLPATVENLAAAHAYLDGLATGGGTNIQAALLEALTPEPPQGTLPIVLFLTDGVPTVETTDEASLRALAISANAHGRRVFTFGVGHDVNAPLLDHVASHSRATSHYVHPGEDVALCVDDVARRLEGPIFTAPAVRFLDDAGAVATLAASELAPAELSDLYAGDQIALLGRYASAERLRVEVNGDFLGQPRTFAFQFDLAQADARNSFVPRLWATRRVAALVDAVRQSGASASAQTVDLAKSELVQSILELSTRYGVLSEYTAFLATEGTKLDARPELLAQLATNLRTRAQAVRTGRAAVAQSINRNGDLTRKQVNRLNRYLQSDLTQTGAAEVQQIAGRTFFKRKGTWIDSRLLEGGAELRQDKIVKFGDAEHRVLLERLKATGENALLAQRGHILLEHEGRAVLVLRTQVGASELVVKTSG